MPAIGTTVTTECIDGACLVEMTDAELSSVFGSTSANVPFGHLRALRRLVAPYRPQAAGVAQA
jgi:hypothetical protein